MVKFKFLAHLPVDQLVHITVSSLVLLLCNLLLLLLLVVVVVVGIQIDAILLEEKWKKQQIIFNVELMLDMILISRDNV